MIVLDSSAAVDYLVGGRDGEWVEARLNETVEIHAPHLIDVEVLGALARLVRLRDLSRRRAEQAVVDVLDLDITRYPHVPFLDRMWELRDNVTSADAAFVALAEALGAPLVTTDRSLSLAPGLRTTILTP